jgi:hypothetical protein
MPVTYKDVVAGSVRLSLINRAVTKIDQHMQDPEYIFKTNPKVVNES